MDKEPFKIMKLPEVESMIPVFTKRVMELLENTEDQAITLLRYFNWNVQKLEEQWFSMGDTKMKDCGLEYDEGLVKKYPDINQTQKENNDNTCPVMYVEFEKGDPDYDSDQLCCGHQFSKISWRMYLKDKIKSNGPQCVFTRCAQLRCNVVVPHSFFLKYLENKQDDDGINYYKKYINWHCKQFTNLNSSMKWCPRQTCDYVVQLSPFCLINVITCHCGNSFCLICEKEDHQPATCNQV